MVTKPYWNIFAAFTLGSFLTFALMSYATWIDTGNTKTENIISEREVCDYSHYEIGKWRPSRPHSGEIDQSFSVSGEKELFVVRTSKDNVCSVVYERDLKEGMQRVLITTQSAIQNLRIHDSNTDISFEDYFLLSPKYSINGEKIYFYMGTRATASELATYDFETERIDLFSAGNSLNIVKSGLDRGRLIINKHYYFESSGSYDHYWLVNENTGEDIRDLGFVFPEDYKEIIY